MRAALPSRCGTGSLPVPKYPLLLAGARGGPRLWGIRDVARPKVVWRSFRALGPAPSFEPMKPRQARFEIGESCEVHVFNEAGENFVDGEDLVRILHSLTHVR